MASKGNTKKIKPEPGIKHEHGQELAMRSPSKRHRSWFLIWYAILTALFRCPTSVNELAPTSPSICRPYIEARSFVSPYISPYYERYATPYIKAAKPYAETFYFKLYTPAAGAVKETYIKYGESRVVQTQKFVQEEWDRSIKPRLDETKSIAQKQYDASVAPYVIQASEKVGPHIRNAQVIASRQYYSTILPTYRNSLPYFRLAYNRVRFVTVEYLYPYSRYGAEVTFDFLSKRIWPRLRIVYGENVEPQLVKIKERLANYREGKEIQAVVDDIDSAVQESKASSSASSSSASKSVESKASVAHDVPSQSTSAGGKPTPYPNQEEEKAQITAELELWQEKFARASDKGAQELKARVEEITSRQIEHQAHGVGVALLTELEESVKTSTGDLKSAIIKSVRSIPDDATADDIVSAEETAKVAIRRAGATIKEKAQKLRTWRASFDEETTNLIKSATDSTLDVVDNIRDLGLQEIGMRWASMDTVTYQDWSKYHSLKKAVDKWRVKVEDVALDHRGLTAAKQESEDIESRGMAIAEEAAKELSRLKDVATWKIRADDSSDDFSSKAIPAIAVKLAQQAKAKFDDVSSAVVGTSQGTVESVSSQVSQSAKSVIDDLSSNLEDQATPNAASSASSAARSVASAASSKVADPPQSKAASSASSAASSVSSAAANVASSVSSRAAQDTVSASKSIARASKSAQSAASVVSKSARSSSSSIDKETVSPASKSASSAYSKVSKEAVSSVSSASQSAASFSSSVSKVAGSSASSASEYAASAAYIADQKIMSPASKVASSASSAAPSMNTAERVKAASAEYAAKLAASASASVSSAASSASASMPSVASSKLSDVSSDASSAASSVIDAASVAASTASASASSQSSGMSTSLSSIISSIQSKQPEEASSFTSSISSKVSSSASAKRPPSGFAMAQPAVEKSDEFENDDDDDDDEDEDSEDEKPPEPTNEAELDLALSEAMDRARSHAASVTNEAFSKASSWKLPPDQTESNMAHHTADLVNAAISMSQEIEKAATAASSEYKKNFISSLESVKSSLASEASESSRRAASRPTEHPEL